MEYVRIIEEYHLRITGEEKVSDELRSALKTVEKDIKKLIFSDDGKPLFSNAFSNSLVNTSRIFFITMSLRFLLIILWLCLLNQRLFYF